MADKVTTRTREINAEHALRALEELYNAWNDSGPVPKRHHRAKARLRSEWPVLAGALDLLTAVILDHPEPRP